MVSEAQKRANQKWFEKNRDKQTLYRHRSATKKFINTEATSKDLDIIEQLVAERRKNIK